ncbi:hypothetical protein JCM11641_008085 [Rhodosporidiobolus odoratus]
MSRKKGRPQRPNGLSRAEQQRIHEQEELSQRLADLDQSLEERHGNLVDGAGREDEGILGDEEYDPPQSASPLVPSRTSTVPSPAQVLYATRPPPPPAPILPRPSPVFIQPPHAPQLVQPPVPLLATLPQALLHAPPAINGTLAAPLPPVGNAEAPPGLSRFAIKYIPLWLRNVNVSLPGHIVPRSPSESLTIDYTPLHNALFPPQLQNHLVEIERKNQARLGLAFQKQVAISGSLLNRGTYHPPLTPTTYALHYHPLLQAEWTARRLQLVQAALYAVPLRPVPPHPSDPPSPPRYILEAKSIREGWPPVDLGDVLTMRQLRPQYQTWQGLEFQASVAGINRAVGEIVLRCDGLMGYEESLVMNVQWRTQDRIFNDWRRAIDLLDLHLTSDMLVSNTVASPPSAASRPTPRKRTAVESWLFPTEEDVAKDAPTPSPEEESCDWVDGSLNEEQKNAVRSILWGRQRLPLLLHGPPGTGKTKTLVEAVLQVLKSNPDAHILVCGASNPSTDTLAMRLRSSAPIFRLNSPSRPFAEVRAELLPFCHVENERFALPAMSTLLSKRVICCTVLDASLLLGARVTNHDLSTLEVYTAGFIHPTRQPPLPKPHFSHLLVDEAGQASEADIGCALAVVATDDTRCSSAHVTVCGDYKQLGPHIQSEDARNQELDVSLLERLMQRQVYAEHPYARKNRRQNTKLKWDIRTTPFVDLLRNYRSTPEILWLPSTEFYHDSLIPSASPSIQNSPLSQWSCLPNRGFPILFHHLSGDDLDIDEGASFFNDLEVQTVQRLILDLVRPPQNDPVKTRHGRVAPKEISVISPFREQVWRIRLALRAVGLGEVDVGNVEALQGAENRVVIISPVRSRELRWLPIDRQQNRGLLFEPKRLNVALTRAKELLLVVGNAETLAIDPYWRAFYRLCLRNDCYIGPRVSSPEANEPGHAVSRLEQESRTRRSQQGREEEREGGEGKDRARDFDVLVGRLASQLVVEDEDEFPPLRA